MRNKVLGSLGVLIGLLVLGGILSGSPKSEVAGTKIEKITVTPSPTTTPAPTITPAPTLTPDPTLAPTPTPKPVVQQTAAPVQDTGLSNDNYYTNTQGNTVHSPAYSNSVPTGATAICGDGTYSFSQSRRGTCSHHGGVTQWL